MKKLLDLTKPVQLRDGTPARILCTDLKGTNPPVVVAIDNNEGSEYLGYRGPDGSLYSGEVNSRDLVNIPERISKFRAVYVEGSVSSAYSSREKVVYYALGGYVKILETVLEDSIPVEVILHEA